MAVILISILFIASSAFAQSDTLNHKIFNALLTCDSVVTAKNDEIIRLEGEVNTKNAILFGWIKFDDTKDTLFARRERIKKEEFDRERVEDFKENRKMQAALLGINFILLIAIISIKLR